MEQADRPTGGAGKIVRGFLLCFLLLLALAAMGEWLLLGGVPTRFLASWEVVAGLAGLAALQVCLLRLVHPRTAGERDVPPASPKRTIVAAQSDHPEIEPTRDVDFSRPRKMPGSPFDQTGCWFCGADDARAYPEEYGWYEEAVTEDVSTTMTHTVTNNTYIPIGRRTVHICERCITGHDLAVSRNWTIGLVAATLVGAVAAFFGGFFWGLFDWLPGPEWVTRLEDVWYHENRHSVPTRVFAGFLALAGWILLIPALLGVLAAAWVAITAPIWIWKPKRRRPQRKGLSREARLGARHWARRLGAAQLTRENAELDPFFLFHPNARCNEFEHVASPDRRTWTRQRNGTVFSYWIEHRRAEVSDWEARPMPPAMSEEERIRRLMREVPPP